MSLYKEANTESLTGTENNEYCIVIKLEHKQSNWIPLTVYAQKEVLV